MKLDARSLLCEIYAIRFPEDEEFAARVGRVEYAVATLDEREQCLIYKRFPGEGKKTTFAKASKEVANLGFNRNPCDGLSTSMAMEIFKKAISKLRGRRKGIIEGEITARDFLNPPGKPESQQVVRGQRISEDERAVAIDELELSVRLRNCLWNKGIRTVGDLLATPPCELLKTKNFGRKCLNEIKIVLEGRGIIYR